MAGPTDVLTEDVKNLRVVDRDLADEIKRVFDRLSSDMQNSNQRLADAMRDSNQRLDRLSGDMQNSNQRLADAMRDSNQRLADAINRLGNDFGNFRVEVVKELGAVNTNLEKELGTINASLGKYQGETATSLKDLGRGITILTPIVAGIIVALVAGAVGFAWKAAKLDSRIEYVELRVHEGSSTIPTDRRVSPVPSPHGSSHVNPPSGSGPPLTRWS